MQPLFTQLFPISQHPIIEKCVAGYTERESAFGSLGYLIYRIIEAVKTVLGYIPYLGAYLPDSDYSTALESIKGSLTPHHSVLREDMSEEEVERIHQVFRKEYAHRILDAMIQASELKRRHPQSDLVFFFRQELRSLGMKSFSLYDASFEYTAD